MAADRATDGLAQESLVRVQSQLRDLAAAVFGYVDEVGLFVDVVGFPAWDFVAILVKFVDRRLPAARVRFGREHPSGGPLLPVAAGDRVLVEFDAEVLEACRLSDEVVSLKQTLFEECSGLVSGSVHSGELTSEEFHSLYYALYYKVKVVAWSGELVESMGYSYTMTVGSLLDEVGTVVERRWRRARLDCLVLPPFARRCVSLGDLFPLRRASLVSSSCAALETLLVELGASGLEHGEDVITVAAVLKSPVRERSRSRS